MRDSGSSSGEERGPGMDSRKRSGRVLVVDDEVVIRTLISEVVAHELRQESVQAGSAEEAIEALQREEISLVISDIRMPGIGGFGLFKWIEAERPDLKQRFLFITGYAGSPEAEATLAKLGVPVLNKPFPCTVLLEQCRKLLNRAQAPDEEVQGRCCLAA